MVGMSHKFVKKGGGLIEFYTPTGCECGRAKTCQHGWLHATPQCTAPLVDSRKSR